MKLEALLKCLDEAAIPPLPPALSQQPVSGVYCRSDQVEAGGLFVAIEGLAADGHDYAPEAVARGAVAVVCQKALELEVPAIRVADSRRALAQLAAAFYGHPSRQMTLVAITGTNGKTTTSFVVESMLAAAGFSAGVIGTINYRFGGRSWDNPVTTPESVDLQKILSRMQQAGVTHVVMEVSSHGLDMYRVHGCDIDVAAFTNLSQDHLDYHKTMEAYWESKRRLFSDYLTPAAEKTGPRAVINIDDRHGRWLAQSLSVPRLTFSLKDSAAQVWVRDAALSAEGIRAEILCPAGIIEVQSALVGTHNLENLACAVGIACALELTADQIVSGINALQAVPGRLEPVPNDKRRHVFVDYAHSPDALANALTALRNLGARRLICLFGCGGDRDADKRPKMGRIASEMADMVVVTSDNPRSEDPLAIIDQIVAGMQEHCLYQRPDKEDNPGQRRFLVEPDRRKAIALAVRLSRPGDTILIAGKGHETYQIIGNTRVAFDDRVEAARALKLVESD